MRRWFAAALAAVFLVTGVVAADWSLALRGGAGVIERGQYPPGEEAAIRQALGDALAKGSAILAGGGPALEAESYVNAAMGAALTSAGTAELDAAIMDGATRRAAAVTGVTITESPVALARKRMETGPHVFL